VGLTKESRDECDHKIPSAVRTLLPGVPLPFDDLRFANLAVRTAEFVVGRTLAICLTNKLKRVCIFPSHVVRSAKEILRPHLPSIVASKIVRST